MHQVYKVGACPSDTHGNRLALSLRPAFVGVS